MPSDPTPLEQARARMRLHFMNWRMGLSGADSAISVGEYAPDTVDALIAAARAEERERCAAVIEALDELHDIVQGHLDDGDTLDSFTLQPARIALRAIRGEG